MAVDGRGYSLKHKANTFQVWPSCHQRLSGLNLITAVSEQCDLTARSSDVVAPVMNVIYVDVLCTGIFPNPVSRRMLIFRVIYTE